MDKQKLNEILRDNYLHNSEIAESEIIKIQSELTECVEKYYPSITPEQIRFTNYAADVIYHSLLKTFESSTENLVNLLVDELKK